MLLYYKLKSHTHFCSYSIKICFFHSKLSFQGTLQRDGHLLYCNYLIPGCLLAISGYKNRRLKTHQGKLAHWVSKTSRQALGSQCITRSDNLQVMTCRCSIISYFVLLCPHCSVFVMWFYTILEVKNTFRWVFDGENMLHFNTL